MGLFDNRAHIDAFRDLLDREKRLILRGDLESVGRLAVEKERLLKRLARTTLKRWELADLRKQAERNSELLAASARGFRAVADELRRVGAAKENLTTYSADGTRSKLGRDGRDFNKRA